MSRAVDELWSVVRLTPQVDPTRLSRAVEGALKAEELDYRTRLLIRDSVAALEGYWDAGRFREWVRGLRISGGCGRRGRRGRIRTRWGFLHWRGG